MRATLLRLFALAVVFVLAGCSTLGGLVRPADSLYQHPDGYFTCAVPGADQFFSAEVGVEQKGSFVEFTDVADEQIQIEILGSGIHGIHQEEYRLKGENAKGVWREQFERGHVLLMGEKMVRLNDGQAARLGVLQMPYWPPDASYLGISLSEAYRTSEAPPVIVRVIANLMVEETHYTAMYSVPAKRFVPADTPLRDVELMRAALATQKAEVIKTMTNAMTKWLATCRLTGFAKAQIPYRPPSSS